MSLNPPLDPGRVGESFGPHRHRWDPDQVALYALACGATERELDLLLESRGPTVLPTFSVLSAWAPVTEGIAALGGDLLTIVHGAQRCRVHRPLQAAAEVDTTAKLHRVYDKGTGALAVFTTESTDGDGLLAETEWQIFYRGLGGFGGERGPKAPDHLPPEGTPPDAVYEDAVPSYQALLYRLVSGDKNPIHAEPAIAQAVGFPKPILHGLCTLGFAARALAHIVADDDAARIAEIEGRFARPVFPGESIRTEAWNTARGQFFRTWVPARNEDAIRLGRVRLFTRVDR
ncbi:MAG: MaoC/PaaZ C-terminal domain-containing protein [Myxococcota bacterium]